MIALIFYQGNVKGRTNPVDAFRLWHFFYKASGTEMPFKIFTNPECQLDSIEGFSLTKLPKSPPCSIDNLSYGDWLRSELYNAVQQPCIYMDTDAFILKPVDNSYFDFDGTLRMTLDTTTRNDYFNSGVIVFKEDFSERYQNTFIENKNDYKYNGIYGQRIWSDIMNECGCPMPSEFHCPIMHIIEKKVPNDIKILHLHGGKSAWIFKIIPLLQNSLKKEGFPLDILKW